MKSYRDFTEEEQILHNSEIRIRQVRGDTLAALRNICERKGISINSYLKEKLSNIINSEPEEMKKPFRP